MTYRNESQIADAGRKETDAQQALETLKSLLIKDERRQIQALHERLDDPVAHAEEIALVLPQALRHAKETDLARALERPLTQSILRAVRHEPKAFAEAVFPILGPAIRRAIAEALRDVVRKLNRVLDHSFSLRGLRWRMEALRSGMEFSEVVLRHTLEYRVEQAFLIRSDDGILISHVSDELNDKQDPDAYSAMLTAIQSFYKDTINVDESISAVDLVEHTALLVHGPLAYIACVIDGEPPYELRGELSDILAEIHARYRDQLQTFSGDRKDTAMLEPELQRCLIAKEKETTQRGMYKRALIVLGLIIAAFGWMSYVQWQKHQLRQAELALQSRAISLLGNLPGIVLTEVKQAPGRLRIRGLRDPLAPDPAHTLQQSDLEIIGFQAQWGSFQSAEPEIAQRRAAQRLDPPQTVNLELKTAGQLVATGYADQIWISRARLLAPTVPGIDVLDISGLTTADALLLDEARKRLDPPSSVDLAANNGELIVSGTAPLQWIGAIPQRIHGAAGLTQLNLDNLAAIEHARIEDLKKTIESMRIRFYAGATDISEVHEETLNQLAEEFQELLRLARLLDLEASIMVIGRTDGTGSPAKNEAIAYDRAFNTRAALHERGIPSNAIEQSARPMLRLNERTSPKLRRVEFEVKLDSVPEDS